MSSQSTLVFLYLLYTSLVPCGIPTDKTLGRLAMSDDVVKAFHSLYFINILYTVILYVHPVEVETEFFIYIISLPSISRLF